MTLAEHVAYKTKQQSELLGRLRINPRVELIPRGWPAGLQHGPERAGRVCQVGRAYVAGGRLFTLRWLHLCV